MLAIAESERAYHMLEEIGVKPNISYMVKVRNIEEEVAHVHETEAAHN